MLDKAPTIVAFMLVIVWSIVFPNSLLAAERSFDSYEVNQAGRVPKISTIGFVTWWSHDAVGYHPAIILKIENTSGVNLTGVVIRFQGRFTDLRNGYVTVARKEIRKDFAPHQQITVPLRGPASFELPIDENAWPAIECKAMCRIGDVGDEGTQDLVITRLEPPVTMTDEEAESQLIRQTGLASVSAPYEPKRDSGQSHRRRRDSVETAMVTPTEALIATAGNLLANKRIKTSSNPAEMGEKGSSSFHVPLSLPGLGDDFYLFERYFGVPAAQNIVASKNDLTWVSYPGKGGFREVFVGSRAASGKADVIVLTVPAKLNPKENQLLAVAKLIAGKGKGQSLTPFVHAVRYLPQGRSEIARATGSDFRVVFFKLPEIHSQEAKTVLAVSRLSFDLENLLATYARRVHMLEVLLPGLAFEQN